MRESIMQCRYMNLFITKKNLLLLLLLVLLTSVTGCQDATLYDSYDFAKELTEHTWSPFYKFIGSNQAKSFTKEDFYEALPGFSESFSGLLMERIAMQNSDGTYSINEKVWIPSIFDKEVEITTYELVKGDTLMLKVTEEGQFVDKNYGFKRTSYYQQVEGDDFHLMSIEGSLGIFDITTLP